MAAFFTDLFTPETWKGFREYGAQVSGFRERQRQAAGRIAKGDMLCCYLVRLSRWCGLLEVISDVFVDATPIFADPDPFVIRFKVRPVVVLDPELSIPIFDDALWPKLSITRGLELRSFGWAQFANMRASLRPLTAEDGELLKSVLIEQSQRRQTYPLSPRDAQRLAQRQTVRAADRTVLVEVPVEPADARDQNEDASPPAEEEVVTFRHSLKIQSVLAQIGIEMGCGFLVPTSRQY